MTFFNDPPLFSRCTHFLTIFQSRIIKPFVQIKKDDYEKHMMNHPHIDLIQSH